LGGIEDKSDVVEGWCNEAAPADVALAVLVLERFLEVEVREERANRGDKESQFRLSGGFFTLMLDWGIVSGGYSADK
jgi:hypothetical protein